jgi:hypothetical protein
MRTKPYPSDLTDAQWALLKPLGRAIQREADIGLPVVSEQLPDLPAQGVSFSKFLRSGRFDLDAVDNEVGRQGDP